MKEIDQKKNDKISRKLVCFSKCDGIMRERYVKQLYMTEKEVMKGHKKVKK